MGEEGGGLVVCCDEELAGAGGEECELGVFGELLLVMDHNGLCGCGVAVAVVVDHSGRGGDCQNGHRERDHHPQRQLSRRHPQHINTSEHIDSERLGGERLGGEQFGGGGVWGWHGGGSNSFQKQDGKCQWQAGRQAGGGWLGLVGFDDGGDPDGVFVVD